MQLRVLNALKTWVEKFWDLDTELATVRALPLSFLCVSHCVCNKANTRARTYVTHTHLAHRLRFITSPHPTPA